MLQPASHFVETTSTSTPLPAPQETTSLIHSSPLPLPPPLISACLRWEALGVFLGTQYQGAAYTYSVRDSEPLLFEFHSVKQQCSKQFSQQGNHTKTGYSRVTRSSGRMGNCLPKTRWKYPFTRRKRYSHKETQTDSYSPSTIKGHFDKKDCMNSSELWYSTVYHDVKHETSVIKGNNQSEYALVNVPKRKENTTSAEEHSEYDYVLIT